MQIRKSRGHSTVPWGTPDSTLVAGDDAPSMLTHIVLSVRKALIQLCMGPFTL